MMFRWSLSLSVCLVVGQVLFAPTLTMAQVYEDKGSVRQKDEKSQNVYRGRAEATIRAAQLMLESVETYDQQSAQLAESGFIGIDGPKYLIERAQESLAKGEYIESQRSARQAYDLLKKMTAYFDKKEKAPRLNTSRMNELMSKNRSLQKTLEDIGDDGACALRYNAPCKKAARMILAQQNKNMQAAGADIILLLEAVEKAHKELSALLLASQSPAGVTPQSKTRPAQNSNDLMEWLKPSSN